MVLVATRMVRDETTESLAQNHRDEREKCWISAQV
jgi:hypothetical protein